jgi:MFS family permease
VPGAAVPQSVHMLKTVLTPIIPRRASLPGARLFHLLIASLGVSSIGDWLYNVALLAFVYARTGSATWVALATAGRVLPIVALGPIGGVVADRVDRRRLMIVSDVARAGLMVALAIVAALGLPIVLAPVLAALATAAGASRRRASRSRRLVWLPTTSCSGPARCARESDRPRLSPAPRSVHLCCSPRPPPWRSR